MPSSKKYAFASLSALAILGLGTAAFLWTLHLPAQRPGQPGEDILLQVPQGASAHSVALQLQEVGLIPSTLVFRYVLWRRGRFHLKAGKFRLARSATPMQLAAALEMPPLAEDIPFTIIEGWRLNDTAAALAAAGHAPSAAYMQATASGAGYHAPFPLPSGTLEGYLYPETYYLPKRLGDVRVLVQKQLDEFAQRIWTPHEAAVRAQKRTLHALVTMASLLEREEFNPKNRPLLAGILWKRLALGYPLGVDATSRYELAHWNDRKAFLKKLRDKNDAYNTRYNKGLSPTPIGAPSASSFKAALHPTPSAYLYYLHDTHRRLHPSRSAAEHEALRKRHGVY